MLAVFAIGIVEHSASQWYRCTSTVEKAIMERPIILCLPSSIRCGVVHCRGPTLDYERAQAAYQPRGANGPAQEIVSFGFYCACCHSWHCRRYGPQNFYHFVNVRWAHGGMCVCNSHSIERKQNRRKYCVTRIFNFRLQRLQMQAHI